MKTVKDIDLSEYLITSKIRLTLIKHQALTLIGNSILFISLVNQSGDKVTEIEIFSDKNGQFTTNLLRIPLDATSGVWTIEANRRLDTASATIDIET